MMGQEHRHTGRSRWLAIAAAALMALSLLAAPAGAGDVEPEVLTTAPQAIVETQQDNLAHYEAVATQSGNWSCRVEKPAFVNQGEVNSRVVVKGEDIAESSAECVDIRLLVPQDNITLRLFLEYYDPHPLEQTWKPILDENGEEIKTECTLSSVKGVGAVVCTLDYVFPANSEFQNRLHRVGAELLSPKSFPPVYTVGISPRLDDAALDPVG